MQRHIQKEYVCHKCGFDTDVFVNFNNHSCGYYDCRKCDSLFNSEDEFTNHVCTNLFKSLEIERAKNIHICSKCNFKCKSVGALKLHNNIHFKGLFRCSYCSHFVTNFKNLFKLHKKHCDKKPVPVQKTNEEHTIWDNYPWSHNELLEIYWCDMWARGLESGKSQGNVGRRRRRMLKYRGNIDPIKLLDTTDRYFYSLISQIRSGQTAVTKRERADVVDNVRKFLIKEKETDKLKEEIPLADLKSEYVVKPKPALQELITTSNCSFGEESQIKSINYSDKCLTKDSFKETNIMKEKTPTKKQESPKRNKKTNKTPRDRWYCHGCSKEKVANMIQCTQCVKWYHEKCINLPKRNIDKFVCPNGCL